MKFIHPTVLVILDGFGYLKHKEHNAIAHARMPNFNDYMTHYPHTLLSAAGKSVGLPEGFDGNSEVGHLTIGAGRIVDQPMKIWLESIKYGVFEHNLILNEQFALLFAAGGSLHILGLLSDAGVHAHEQQMYAVIDMAVKAGIKKIVVHAILDGRDVLPQSAHMYLERLQHIIKHYPSGQVIIGSLHGRFYAMDRDNNWDRIEQSYRVLTEQEDGPFDTWERVLERNYAHAITDEFIPPTQLHADACVHNGDGILFCNVRPDRARELTDCFVRSTSPADHLEPAERFIRKPLNLIFFLTPTEYDVNLATMVFFPHNPLKNTLKDALAAHNKTIFTIAETEKYAHVTYFFRGENEMTVSTETRVMIPSLHEHNYINFPRMSADAITIAVCKSLRENAADFYLINYANADMVGHSGNFDATVRAVECLDEQLRQLYELVVEKMNGTLYITADHGKAEEMYDNINKQPRTAHTNNKVPFVMIKKELKDSGMQLPLQGLSAIAPFILSNMGINVPDEMQ